MGELLFSNHQKNGEEEKLLVRPANDPIWCWIPARSWIWYSGEGKKKDRRPCLWKPLFLELPWDRVGRRERDTGIGGGWGTSGVSMDCWSGSDNIKASGSLGHEGEKSTGRRKKRRRHFNIYKIWVLRISCYCNQYIILSQRCRLGFFFRQSPSCLLLLSLSNLQSHPSLLFSWFLWYLSLISTYDISFAISRFCRYRQYLYFFLLRKTTAFVCLMSSVLVIAAYSNSAKCFSTRWNTSILYLLFHLVSSLMEPKSHGPVWTRSILARQNEPSLLYHLSLLSGTLCFLHIRSCCLLPAPMHWMSGHGR